MSNTGLMQAVLVLHLDIETLLLHFMSPGLCAILRDSREVGLQGNHPRSLL